MNSILVPPSKTSPKGRVLAIEPDHSRARTLKDLLASHIDGVVEIVASVDGALRSIGKQIPDVVLTSAFLTPADSAKLTDQLKSLSGASHVQVIITPHFIDSEDSSRSTGSRVFNLRKARVRRDRPACDPGTLVSQIDEYLEQARAQAHLAINQELQAVLSAAPALALTPKPEMKLVKAPQIVDASSSPKSLAVRLGEVNRLVASDRRRDRRRQRGELPWLWSAKLPWGTEVTLVDVSKSGVQIETTSRVTLGSTLDLQFVGQNTNVSVPARILRSDVAEVNGLGVRYRVAASFNRDFELMEPQPGSTLAPARPAALAEMLARVLADLDRPRGGSALRSRFEDELRQLLPVRNIQLRDSPLMSTDDDESIYFSVPGGSGSPVLQATFERNSPPSALDFKLLKAAASLAAVVLEFAPLTEEEQSGALACR
jgi:hypothetical protein